MEINLTSICSLIRLDSETRKSEREKEKMTLQFHLLNMPGKDTIKNSLFLDENECFHLYCLESRILMSLWLKMVIINSNLYIRRSQTPK
jgi:hypothetical protein